MHIESYVRESREPVTPSELVLAGKSARLCDPYAQRSGEMGYTPWVSARRSCSASATEDGLELRALYGPTGRNEWVGPVGKGTLEPFAYDKPVMQRWWELSEVQTGYAWDL